MLPIKVLLVFSKSVSLLFPVRESANLRFDISRSPRPGRIYKTKLLELIKIIKKKGSDN